MSTETVETPPAGRRLEPLVHLADFLARDLLTNGNGEVAKQLKMILPDGRDGGGWSVEGLASRIRTLLADRVYPVTAVDLSPDDQDRKQAAIFVRGTVEPVTAGDGVIYANGWFAK